MFPVPSHKVTWFIDTGDLGLAFITLSSLTYQPQEIFLKIAHHRCLHPGPVFLVR